MSRKRKALGICGLGCALVVLFVSLGHGLQHTGSHALRAVGRRALWVRVRVGAGSASDLLEAVSAAIRMSEDEAERRRAFAEVRELRDRLTASERNEFSAGVRDMFLRAPSDAHALILVIGWEDDFSNEFFLSALWADSQHARYVASSMVMESSRKGEISAEEIASALQRCLRLGIKRNDVSMIVDALEAAWDLHSALFCVREQEILRRFANHNDDAVRKSARWCLVGMGIAGTEAQRETATATAPSSGERGQW